MHQRGSKLGDLIEFPLRISVLGGDVLSFYVATLAQPAELPRHGRTHELVRTKIDTLSEGLSSAAAHWLESQEPKVESREQTIVEFG